MSGPQIAIRLTLCMMCGLLFGLKVAAKSHQTKAVPKKFDLRVLLAVGDKTKVVYRDSTKIELVGRTAYFQSHHAVYTDEILGVDRQRRETAIRRTYGISREANMNEFGEMVERITDFEGKIVEIRKVGDHPEVSVIYGELTDDDLSSLRDLFKSRFFPIRGDDQHPIRPVSVGTTWKGVTPTLPGTTDTATISVKNDVSRFPDVVVVGGHKCGRIITEAEGTAILPADITQHPAHVVARQELFVAVDLKRDMKVNRTSRMMGRGPNGQRFIETCDAHESYQILRVGNK